MKAKSNNKNLPEFNYDEREKIEKLNETQQLLEQSINLYASLFDYSPVGMATLDKSGIIKNINITLSEMLGYERNNIPGTPFFVYVTEEYHTAFRNHLRTINNSNERGSIELKMKSRIGGLRLVQLFTNPIFDITSEANLLHMTLIDITELRKDEEQIKSALKEKEILLRELYHRTKNNLQVIFSLLNLKIAGIKDESMQEVLTEMGHRIQTIALVHQKLYQAKDLSKIDLKIYIMDLSNLLLENYGAKNPNITISFDLESILVLIDTAIPCGLVVNELITNSFKHAFPGEREGEIKVQLSKNNDGFIVLRISDNGIGVSDKRDKTDYNKIGVMLFKNIVESQLRGEVEYETHNGVSCLIRFKDDFYKARV